MATASVLLWSATLAHAYTRRAASIAALAAPLQSPRLWLPALADEPATPPQSFTTASGLQITDLKIGSGPTPTRGDRVRVDLTMFTTGARYGAKIYSTRDSEEPYAFTLGDSTTIAGLQEAVAGMRAGSVRRVVIPASQGFVRTDLQPQPPTFGEYQRFKNIYLNPNRPYQPDLVLDIKLFQGFSRQLVQ